jgi:poly(hydroxyalkanoate) granule-associated protein
MSINNIESIKERVSSAEDFAKKIWLAGLGAYGKSYDDIQERIDSLNVSRLFNDLVKKGEQLEMDTKIKIKQKTEQTIKPRIHDVREKLGLNTETVREKIDHLAERVEQLAASVEQLSIK